MRARRMSDFPSALFERDNDPELEWHKAVAEFHAAAMQLTELETFFQPRVLELVCEYANEHDSPKKRTYIPGLLSVTMKRGNKLMICMPRQHHGPDGRA